MAKESYKSIKAKLAKKYDLRIASMSDVIEPTDSVSSGNLALDHILGIGGFPRGRSIELFGSPSSGKSSCATMLAASTQKLIKEGHPDFKDKVILYMDHENAMDLEYAKALGLDVEHESFEFSQPDSFEQSANVVIGLIETGDVALVIFDSVAAMVAEAALALEIGSNRPMIQAKLMSDFLKKLNGLAARTKTTVIFLNHIMEVVDMSGGPGARYKKYSTPGGRALKFYASVRIEFKQIKNHKAKSIDELTRETVENVESTDVLIQIVKSKVAPPFKRAVVRVRFGRGFDNAYTALQVLVGHKKIIVAGGRFHYFHNLPELVTDDMPRAATGTHRPYIDTESQVFEWLDSKPEWRAKFIQAAEDLLKVAPALIEAPIADEELAELQEEAADSELAPEDLLGFDAKSVIDLTDKEQE